MSKQNTSDLFGFCMIVYFYQVIPISCSKEMQGKDLSFSSIYNNNNDRQRLLQHPSKIVQLFIFPAIFEAK